jgi:hypothetical protein
MNIHRIAAKSAKTPAKLRAGTHPKWAAIQGVKTGAITPLKLVPVFIVPDTVAALSGNTSSAVAK